MSELVETDYGYIVYNEYLGLKIGDVVQLKSGGPDMTITSISKFKDNPDSDTEAHCEWFVQHPKTGVFGKEQGNFHPATLKKAN